MVIAEAGPREEERSVRHGVTGHDELQLGIGDAKARTNLWRGDIDDGDVERRHERAREQYREHRRVTGRQVQRDSRGR